MIRENIMVNWVKLTAEVQRLANLPFQELLNGQDGESVKTLRAFEDLDQASAQFVLDLFKYDDVGSRQAIITYNKMVLDDFLAILGTKSTDDLGGVLRMYLSALWAGTLEIRALNLFSQPLMPANRACLYIANAIKEPSDQSVVYLVAPTVKMVIGNPLPFADAVLDPANDFIPSRFLLNARGDALLAVYDIFSNVGANAYRLLPPPRMTSISAARMQQISDIPLLKVSDEDCRQLRHICEPTSRVLFEELERRHLAQFDQTPSVFSLLDGLQRALMASSKAGDGTDFSACLLQCEGVVRDFYQSWKALAPEVRADVAKRSFGGELELESFLLVIFSGTYGVTLTDEQMKRVREEDIFPCTHQIGGYIGSILSTNPDLRRLYLDPAHQSVRSLALMSQQDFDKECLELDEALCRRGACFDAAATDLSFDSNKLRLLAVAAALKKKIRPSEFNTGLQEFYFSLFAHVPAIHWASLLDGIEMNAMPSIDMRSLANVLKHLPDSERRPLVIFLRKYGLLKMAPGRDLGRLFCEFLSEGWSSLTILFAPEVDASFATPLAFAELYFEAFGTTWPEIKERFAEKVTPYFTDPKEITLVLEKMMPQFRVDYLAEVFLQVPLPFTLKPDVLACWIQFLPEDDWEVFVTSLFDHVHVDYLLPEFIDVLALLGAFNGQNLSHAVNLFAKHVAKKVTSVFEVISLLNQLPSASSNIISALSHRAMQDMQFLLRAKQKKACRQQKLSAIEINALDALCQYGLPCFLSHMHIKQLWEEASSMQRRFSLSGKLLTLEETALKDNLDYSNTLERDDESDISRFIAAVERVNDINGFFSGSVHARSSRFGAKLDYAFGREFISQLKICLDDFEKRRPEAFRVHREMSTSQIPRRASSMFRGL